MTEDEADWAREMRECKAPKEPFDDPPEAPATTPAEGLSLTTGEAAARRAALVEAAQKCEDVAALTAPSEVQYRSALTVMAKAFRDMAGRAAAGDARDAEAEHWRLRFQHMRDQRDAARQRIAELEQEVADVARWHEAAVHKLATRGDAFARGAGAMREAAAKAIEDTAGGIASYSPAIEEGAVSIIRALPLPQEAGDE